MFLQNLLNKLAEIFSPKSLRQLIINNFRDILVIVGSIGFIFIILILLGISIKYNRMNKQASQTAVTQVQTVPSIPLIDVDLLISPHDLLLPYLVTFDITSDYISFLPQMNYKLPEIKVFNESYDKILQAAIDETNQFQFNPMDN